MTTNRVIRDYLLFQFLNALPLSFIFPLFVLFLQDNGLSLGEVGLVNLGFMASLMVFQVPTGVMADLWGRRLTSLFGIGLLSIACFMYYISFSLLGFLLAEIVMGLGVSCMSGAVDAWVREGLMATGAVNKAGVVFGLGAVADVLAILIGGVIGGSFATGDIRMVWLIIAITYIPVLLVLIRVLREEKVHREPRTWREEALKIRDMAVESVRYGYQNKVVWLLIVVSAMTTISVQGLNLQWSVMVEDKLGRQAIAGVWFGITLMALIGMLMATWLLKEKSREKLLLLVSNFGAGVMVLVAILFDSGWFIMGFVMLSELPRGFFRPTYKTYLHDHLPSDKRATVDSFSSMVSTMAAGVAGVVIGLVADATSISMSWLFCAIGLLVSAMFVLKLPKNGE